MIQYHNPIRQENYLRESLAHDKKPLGFLLGAGAPMAIRVANGTGTTLPLIPDITDMTKQIQEVLSKDSTLGGFLKTICSNISNGGLLNPNIEEILTHIRSLRQVAGDGEVRGLTAVDLELLDGAICDYINEIVSKSHLDKSSPYHKLAAWVNAISRTNPIEVFTTNYDLLMEEAFEDLKVPYFDGFVGSRLTFFDPYTIDEDHLPFRWARLWKLHGSINWLFDNEKKLLYRTMVSPQSRERRVIHPSHLKYDESRKMPYLALMDRLKTFTRKPSALLISNGYSFRDQHLNEIMIEGLQGNPTAIIFAFLYGKLENYPEAIKLAKTSPNLSLLAADAAVIGMKQLSWTVKNIEDIIPESIAVNWVRDESNGSSTANFNLGDFECLGNFFEDIIGGDRKEKRDND
jgi:hypothetical protein